MHATLRDSLILKLLNHSDFVSFKEFESQIHSSPATIRRDLERLSQMGKLARVRGGAKAVANNNSLQTPPQTSFSLMGVPFHENINKMRSEKLAIGQAAAKLCLQGEGIMVDGGSTTLQMCPHLSGLNLQVLTNSLHIVSALIGQTGTRVLVPSGAVFPEQNIILSLNGNASLPRFHAPKLFMGAASIGAQGLMQADIVLVAAERSLLERADQVIVLVDSSKFEAHSGNVVCELDEIDIIITDAGITDRAAKIIDAAGIKLIIA